MMRSLVLLSGAALVLGVGATQAGELYGGASAIGASELAEATGMFAGAESFSHAGNGNLTLQANVQGSGILGFGQCSNCGQSSSNHTSQSATSTTSSTATNTTTVSGNNFAF